MADYIAKWHRELGIFCRIKPLIIVEGNVLDVYQYPVDGSSLLLTTDGVHDYVDIDHLESILNSDASGEEKCDQILTLAQAAGSGDDLTVILACRD